MRVAVIDKEKSGDGKVYVIGRGECEDAHCSLGETVKITLDNGKILWGYECWWMEEGEFDDINKKRGVEIINDDGAKP